MELSKPREQLWDVLLCDASACVFNMHHQTFNLLVIAGFDLNFAFRGELLGVLNQVDHHLLKPSDVAL